MNRKKYFFLVFLFLLFIAIPFLPSFKGWIEGILEKLGGGESIEVIGGTRIDFEFVVAEQNTGKTIQGAVIKIMKAGGANEGWESWQDHIQLTTDRNGKADAHHVATATWTQSPNSKKVSRLNFPYWGIHVEAEGYVTKFTDTYRLGWDLGPEFETTMKVKPQRFLIQLEKR
jgi:hypothetical protein